MANKSAGAPLRILAVPLAGYGLAVALFVGCNGKAVVVAEPDAAADAATPATFGTSDCGSCVATSCNTERTACGGEPSCAAYLSCVEACPLDATGNVDESCAGACPAGTGDGTALETAYTTCRQSGAGASCAACGNQPDAASPILNQQCSASTSSDPCTKCRDEHCCDTNAACTNQPDCAALAACLIGCEGGSADGGESACEDACYDAHPQGLAVLAPHSACDLLFCGAASACNLYQHPTCETCTDTKCANEYAACIGDPNCYRVSQCADLCNTDSTCIAACESAHPSATPLLGALAQCDLAQCKAECTQ